MPATARPSADNPARKMQIEYDEQRLKELMLYVAEKLADDAQFGSIKLNKVLFYSDFLAYGQFGRPITGATYRRLARGPAPRVLPEIRAQLIEDREAVEAPGTRFGHQRSRLVPLRSADLSIFSALEIALVDTVIEDFRQKNAYQVSEYSHKEAAWQLAPTGEDIPYSAVFLSSQKPSLSDMERGQEIAKEHGWLAPSV
jgi:hypothetical protein